MTLIYEPDAMQLNTTMELSEKIKFCATCKKSKRDIQRGIVCGLTNEKPAFENTCPDIDIDETEVAKTNKITKEARKNEISGGLAFFLWAIIGLTSAATFAYSVYYYNSIGARLFFSIGNLIVLITAIYCIASFYKQNSNSVAVAYAYTAMITISTIYSVYVGIITHENINAIFIEFFLGMILCTSLFLYVTLSPKIKYIFPKEIRSHKKTEIILVVAYSACMLFYLIVLTAISSFTGDILNSRIYNFCENDKGKIMTVAENTNIDTPFQILNNLYFMNMSVSSKDVVYKYMHTDKSRFGYTDASLVCFAKVMKNRWLKETFTNPVDDITNCIAKTEYGIRCEYYDLDTILMYVNKIPHEEVVNLIQSTTSYRCRKEDYEFILRYTKHEFPITNNVRYREKPQDVMSISVNSMSYNYESNNLYIDVITDCHLDKDSYSGSIAYGDLNNSNNNRMTKDLKLNNDKTALLYSIVERSIASNYCVMLAMIDDADIVIRYFDKSGELFMSQNYQYEHILSISGI